MVRSVLAAVAVLGVFVAAPSASAAPAVKVVKIYYDSPGTDSRSTTSLNAEYVVLKNVTTSTRSITGWTVRDSYGWTYKFGTLSLGPGKTVVLHTGKGTNTTAHRYWQRGSYVWNNDRDTAYLRNSAGTLIHTCAYNSTAYDYKVC